MHLNWETEPRWRFPALLAVMALVFYRFHDSVIIFRDAFRLYAPLKWLVHQGWAHGRVIGWNPHVYLGQPLAADVLAGYFYPLNFVYLLLPFERAHTLFILLHFPIAAISMDLLLGRLKLSSPARLLGGLAFALSGYLVCQHSNPPYLMGPAWAPLAGYFFARALSTPRIRLVLAAGAVLALQVLAGEPQSAAITAALLAGGGLVACVKGPRRTFPLAAALGAALFGFALAAVQVMPTLEFMTESVRAQGLDYKAAVVLSYRPASMIDLIWPTPLGVIWPDYRFWGHFALDSKLNNPWSIANYLGLTVMVLAGIGAVTGRKPARWFAAAALLFLFIAFGHYTPFYGGLFHYVPFFDKFRFPSKYLAWFTLMIAVLAAIGLERVIETARQRPKLVQWGALIFLACTVLGLAASAWLWPLALRTVMHINPQGAKHHFVSSHILHTGIQVALVNLSVGALVLVMARKPRLAGGAAYALVALVALDLTVANVLIMPAAPPDFYTFKPAAREIIESDGPIRPGGPRIHHLGMDYLEADASSSNLPGLARQIHTERSTLLSQHETREGLSSLTGYSAATPSLGQDLLDNSDLSLWELFNVGYLLIPITRIPPHAEGVEIMGVDNPDNLSVYRVGRAFPRAYWIGSALGARDAEEAQLLLRRVNPRETAVITGLPHSQEAPPTREFAPAVIERYEPDRVAVKVDAPSAGWLVLSDHFYPGWSARVDGVPARILPADVAVRAVAVPPGEHRVEFSFQVRGLFRGALISGVALFLGMMAVGVEFLVERRRLVSGPG